MVLKMGNKTSFYPRHCLYRLSIGKMKKIMERLEGKQMTFDTMPLVALFYNHHDLQQWVN
jgi:hypothetical protein